MSPELQRMIDEAYAWAARTKLQQLALAEVRAKVKAKRSPRQEQVLVALEQPGATVVSVMQATGAARVTVKKAMELKALAAVV